MSFFFIRGLEHITDWNGYDHILFILSLTAVYTLQHWRVVVGLVTCFTLGHSLSLALATLEWVKVNSAWVEFLIPVTILITCIYNLLIINREIKTHWLHYAVVVVLGLIHGLGFSNYIRMMLTEEESLFVPLLAFNLGLEAGQLLIVGVSVLLNFLVVQKMQLEGKWWNAAISVIIGLLALNLAVSRLPW